MLPFWLIRILGYGKETDQRGLGEDESDDRLWLDIIQTVVRLLLNIFAGFMIAAGYGTHHQWEQFSAIMIVVSTLAWALFHQKVRNKRIKQQQEEKRKDQLNEKNTSEPDDPAI